MKNIEQKQKTKKELIEKKIFEKKVNKQATKKTNILFQFILIIIYI